MIRPESLNRKKNKKVLNTGGNIGAAIGSTAAFIPGVGPVAAPVVGAVGSAIGGKIGSFLGGGKKEPEVQATKTRATMGYKYGGKYKRHLKYNVGGNLPSAAQPIGPDAVKYDGPQHEQGGIPIDEAGNPTDDSQAVAEVEGNETRQGDFIFSDELMVPGGEMTFAEAHEMLLEEGAGEEQIEQLAQMQEQVKQEQGIDSEGAAPMEQQPMEQAPMPQEQPQGQSWGEAGMMKKGGKVPKYADGGSFMNLGKKTMDFKDKVNNFSPESSGNTDWAGVAQRVMPSVTRLASAAFADKPKETPKMQARTMNERNPAFAAGRNRQAAGFRANPTQGGHAQYTQGVNQLAAQEAQDRTQREQFNNQAETRADQFNIQNEVRDNERMAQHQAAQIKLIDDAIQGPLNQMAMDKRGKEQMKATLMTASAQINNPRERKQFIQEALSMIEGGESLEKAVEKAQMKYGGKINK